LTDAAENHPAILFVITLGKAMIMTMTKKFFYLTAALGCFFIAVPLVLSEGFNRGASYYIEHTIIMGQHLLWDSYVFFGAMIFGILGTLLFIWSFTGDLWIRLGKWIKEQYNAPYKPPRN